MTIPVFLKNKTFLLSLILLLGCILRFYKADFQSLWFDELIVMNTANPANSFTDIIHILHRNIHPPLFYLLVNLWFHAFGYTELAARLLSACFGVLGILAIYGLGKVVRDERLGLFAALILAINYFHLYYSQEVRSYALLFLLATVSYTLFIKLVQSPGIKGFILITLVNIALIYTHYYGMFICLAQSVAMVYLFLRKGSKTRFLLFMTLSFLLTALSYYAWISTLMKAVSSKSIWIGRPSITDILEYLYQYTGKDPLLTLLFTALVVFFFINLYKSLRNIRTADEASKKDADIQVILLLWIIIGIGMPFIRSQFSTPMLLFRYTLITLPVLILWAGMGWMQLPKTNLKNISLALVLVSTLINFVFFNQYYTKITKEQWRELAHTVTVENHITNYRIFSFWDQYYRYYLQHEGSKQVAANPGKINFSTELQNEKGFWILTGHNGIDIFWNTPELSSEQKLYIRDHFIQRKQYKFHSSTALLYERVQ